MPPPGGGRRHRSRGRSSLAVAWVAALVGVRSAWLIGFAGPCGPGATRTRTPMPGRTAAAAAPAPSAAAVQAGDRPIRKWGQLSDGDLRRTGGGAQQLGEFLHELAQLAPCRYAVNGLSILEARADMRGGRAEVEATKTKSGKTVLTLASKDGGFRLRLDADAISSVALEDPDETGLGVVHLLDDRGRKHLTAVMLGDDALAHFEVLRGRWTRTVLLKA
mmetsp:Transcript_66928/g.207284  ORF Transcript_66928/g.207284 Transcript_66928/m.207284 type:complete len:219 (-) Transcript_66928:78-734(-)